MDALSFFRGQHDPSHKDLLVLSRVAAEFNAYFFALLLVLAALLVTAMSDRVTGRRNGVLQYVFYVYTYCTA